MDEVEKFIEAYARAIQEPSDNNLLTLLHALLPFSPAGIEWGLEIASLAGVTYMLEDGRAIAVKVSRDEFGPFMQTSVAQVSLNTIPSAALKNIKDVKAFVNRVAEHLSEWARRMPDTNPVKKRVETLLMRVRQLD
ncbi:hypothetical protein CSUB_C0010 [Candidatus Caldarchaeum subterraneum]|uniref:Uncharacterized protein n=1 Tax=Caldiarchaeum subterraneum TaxID=311458 RepID=E6N442_CALS0|nr:hypothetical protein HGMM_F51C10C16 [Candidatus Caldarchaeum subterraneum]BAJ49879.1 hypothetical protein CSUB_C0010 [Candidatus Caldarchaeum subterraneum]